MAFNRRFDGSSDDGLNTIWTDTTFLLALSFVALLLIIIAFVSEKAKKVEDTAKTIGDVQVHAVWPDKQDVDIDLWCQAPDDVPVGYSNLGGVIFNLVRDDRGFMFDTTGLNYENCISKGRPAGEYVINLQYFMAHDNLSEVPVKVVVSVRSDGQKDAKEILTRDVVLYTLGEEITVFRFTLREDGILADDSINHLFKPLRSPTKSGDWPSGPMP